MSKAKDLADAQAENAEVKSWTCKHCDTMVEVDGDLCRACIQYAQDCADGVFDEPDYGYDTQDDCDHHDAEIGWEGRAVCHCGYKWWASAAEIEAQERHQRKYAEWEAEQHAQMSYTPVRDFIGYLLVAYGPWRITSDCRTAFGRWCVSHAGAWAYSPNRN